MAQDKAKPDVTATTSATIAGGADGAVTDADSQQTDERAGWSREEWERFASSEADRRVTQALKQKETEYKTLLSDQEKTAEEKLKAYETQLANERARAVFAEQALENNVSDIKAAWAVAREYGLVSDDRVDWSELRERHPSLFAQRKQTSAASAPGDVNGQPPDINTLLRRAAGYGR